MSERSEDVADASRRLEERARRIAKHFVQTVVLVDDQAAYAPDGLPTPRNIEEGSDRELSNAISASNMPDSMPAVVQPGGGLEYEEPLEADADPVPSGMLAALDAKQAVDEFAKQGLACTILTPQRGASHSKIDERLMSVSARSDVFILDWILERGDGGAATLGLLDQLLREARQPAKRLRLICIYTSDPDLGSIHARLVGHFVQAEQDANADALVINASNFRIVILGKSTGSQGGGPYARNIVPLDKLPQRVIEEFAMMSRGLLRGLALSSLAVLRDAASDLLARFAPELDPAFVSHALLADDPEQFAVQLVAREIEAMLDAAGVRKEVSREPVLIDWVDERTAGPEFKPGLLPAPAKEVLVEPEWVRQLVREPRVALDDPSVVSGQKAAKMRQSHIATVTRAFVSSDSEAASSDRQLGILSCISRHHLQPQSAAPVLRLGTIISGLSGFGHENETTIYLICAQPLCDSVRVEGERPFPFFPAKLPNLQSDFDAIILDENGEPRELQVRTKPYETRTIVFNADAQEKIVRATRDGEFWCFTDREGQIWTWLGDLRTDHAHRLTHNAGTDASRIGLDESEWLRLNGRNKAR